MKRTTEGRRSAPKGRRFSGRWLLLLVVALAACRGEDQMGSREDSEEGRPSTLTIAYCCDEWLMSPFWGMPITHAMFLSLTRMNADGELEGHLASHWEHSDDYREWIVHLRTDVRWHDGAPVTAHDVKFTLDLMKHPEFGSAADDAYEVTVVDDSTYRIRYEQSGPGNPLDWYTVYYPRHLLEDVDPASFGQAEFWTEPVGNGPFRYVRHQPALMMELEGNPDFYAGKPAVERLVIKFTEGVPALTDLLAGEVDLAPMVNRLDALQLAANERFQVLSTPAPFRAKALFWNHRRDPFADLAVRTALTLAVDRPALLSALDLPEDTPLFDVIFTPVQFRRGELPEPRRADRTEAVRRLSELGWADTDGDGVLDRNGRPFRFTALVTPGRELETVSVIIQEQLRRIGIAMELQPVDGALRTQRIAAGDFDAAFVDHLMADPTSPVQQDRLLGPGSIIGYEREELFEILEAMRETVVPEEQERLYRQLWPALQEDLPVLFLYPTVWWTAATKSVRGLDPRVSDPAIALDALRIERDSLR
jgi:peptide/nickel transport system substrate-binding protein